MEYYNKFKLKIEIECEEDEHVIETWSFQASNDSLRVKVYK
jgi:hypothetical protein